MSEPSVGGKGVQRLRLPTLIETAAMTVIVGPAGALLAGYGWDGAVVMLAGGLSAGILSRIQDLEQLTAWGFNAKLREAKQIAEKATIAAEELRRLALPIARMSLGMAIGGGRWGGHEGVRDRTREHVEALLATINATSAERTAAYTEWRAWEHVDAAGEVEDRLREAVRGRLPPGVELPSELRNLEALMFDVDRLAVAPAASWREVAGRLDALTPAVAAALAELERVAAADLRPNKHDGMPRPTPQ